MPISAARPHSTDTPILSATAERLIARKRPNVICITAANDGPMVWIFSAPGTEASPLSGPDHETDIG
jgi:hypothetical protein